MTFAYHNRIKDGLYRLIPPGSNILDLGSGRGGDVRKWVRLSQKGRGGLVVAVEPNPDHIVTLRARINTFNMNERVQVVQASGEDSATITQAVRQFIPGGKVDAITLMLSLSFFWESDAHLNALVETIVTNLKPGGSIIFLTVNGTAIQQIMEPGLRSNWIQDLDVGGAHIHLYPPTPGFGRALDFDLPGSIVGYQREYLVHLEDLSRRLAPHGINLIELHRAEDEKLLSKPNLVYSSLYSYGFYESDPKTSAKYGAPPRTSIVNLPTHPLAHTSTSSPAQGSSSSPTQGSNSSPKRVVLPPLSQGSTSSPKRVILPPLSQGSTSSPKRVILPPLSLPKRAQVIPAVAGPQWMDILDPGAMDRSRKLRDDDTYAPVECTWFTDVVRITTIGDGSCFIHAVLKAFDGAYQSNQKLNFRTNRVQAVRRDLAIKLGDPDPEYPAHTYWDTIGDSGLVINTMRQLNDDEQIRDADAMYTLSGMQRLFNSTQYLGDEVYTFVAQMMGIDIFILSGKAHDIERHLTTHRTGINRPTIFVVATGNLLTGDKSCGHYETIGIMTDQGIQTVFDHDHPFVQALIAQYEDGALSFVHRAFDPDQVFVREFGLIFSEDSNLVQTTRKMRHVFDPSDPFVLSVNRLYPDLLRAIRTPDPYLPHLLELNKIGWAMLPYYARDQFEAIDRILERIDAQIRLHPTWTFEALLEAVESEGVITPDIMTFIDQLRQL
jgi:SAM-dependent methyltransferase